MPIHDWTRVDAGTWHSFDVSWIAEMKRVLNAGALPDGYYAEAEKPAPPVVPDLLALQEFAAEIINGGDDNGYGGAGPNGHDYDASESGGAATAVAAPPRLTLRLLAPKDAEERAAIPRRIAVRHESGDRLVALLELASPANKDRPASVDSFAAEAVAALASGVHVSVVDPFPPRRHDTPGGLVGAVAIAAGLGDLDPPAGKPLMIGAFEAARRTALYAEPLAVGDEWPALPLFYRRGRYVDVPLAATYAAAWDATPRRWRAVVEG